VPTEMVGSRRRAEGHWRVAWMGCHAESHGSAIGAVGVASREARS
jgi:hypothetical protein